MQDDRPSLPSPLALLPMLCLVVALNQPPSSTATRRGLYFLPIIAASALVPPLMLTTSDVAGDFGFASAMFYLLLTSFDRLLFSNAPKSMCRLHQKVAVKDMGRGESLWWSVGLITTMRGSGWTWRSRNTPASSTLSRPLFLAHRMLRATLCYLIVDVASRYVERRPYFRQLVRLDQVDLSERFVNQVAVCVVGAAVLSLEYDIISAAGVAVRLWSIEECPDLFGAISHATSVRGFWNKTW